MLLGRGLGFCSELFRVTEELGKPWGAEQPGVCLLRIQVSCHGGAEVSHSSGLEWAWAWKSGWGSSEAAVSGGLLGGWTVCWGDVCIPESTWQCVL